MAKTGLIIGIIVVIVIVIAGVFLLTMNKGTTSPGSSGSSSGGNTGGSTGGSTSTPTTKDVTIQGFAFSPSTLTIKAGDTVVWTNDDGVTHTVTSDSGSELSSSNVMPGQVYSHTFNTAGTYNYHCSIHPSMKATIIVQ